MTEGVQRRLAAILAADVAGYSRLMGEDETSTLNALRQLRTELFAPTVDHHRGKVVKSMGDGWLVEFASVVDAVTCAIEIQEGLAAHESIKLRVGVHLGDITHEEEDIFGDGVNIAARLQDVAQPGGIVISDMARRSIGRKLATTFVGLGVHNLKNIAEPVTAYGWGMTATTADAPALPRPDKPSIAVLSFTNMSGDPEQAYFSDGITEDIITEISRFQELFVIARNSSFSYKGKAAKIQDIAKDLRVRYVLEGSVRFAGERMRITTQLIDAESGHHIWAERYDRKVTDLFALQDEIAQTVAGTVAGRLRLTAEEAVARKPIESLEAYDYVLRGQSIVATTKERNVQARQCFQKAIERDPNFARAYVGLAQSYQIDWFNQWYDPSDLPLDKALKFAAQAVSLDNTDSRAHVILGNIYVQRRDFKEALVHLNRALELNPNDADGFAYKGNFLNATGKPDEAIEVYKKALGLNPYYPAWYLWMLGSAYFNANQYEKAVGCLRECLDRNPRINNARVWLVASYAQLDRIEEAQEQVRLLLSEHPEASLKLERDWAHSGEAGKRYVEALQIAGLPE